tara:strand:- start:56 stop:418 length:363 start_codon:yes stop_codon:yes gene_type:complete
MVTDIMTFVYLLGILAVVVIAVAFLQLKKTDFSQLEETADNVLDEFFGDTKPVTPPIDLFADSIEPVKVIEVKEVTPEVKELVKELVAEPISEIPVAVKEPVGVAPKKKKKKYIKPKPKQ